MKPPLAHRSSFAAPLVVGLVVGAALSSSCASDGASGGSRRNRSGSGEIRTLDELPEAHRQLLYDYRSGGAVWEERRAALHGEPELVRFLVENLVVEAVRAFQSARIAEPDRGRGPYERAQRELAEFAEHSVPYLTELIAMPDDMVAFVAAETLTVIGRPGLAAVLANLEHDAWKVRLRTAELAGQLPHAGSDEREDALRALLVERLSTDPAWVVRAQAARSLGERGARDRVTEPTRHALVRALGDEDLGVARRAAEGLGKLGDPEAAAAVRRYVDRAVAAGDLDGVRTGEAALRALGTRR